MTADVLYRIGVAAQGAVWNALSGTGALLDLGATGSRFTASADLSARTPPGGHARLWSAYRPFFQGALKGIFAADDTNPVIVSSPSRAVCSATSVAWGFGHWSGCGILMPQPTYQLHECTPTPGPDPSAADPGHTPVDQMGLAAGEAPLATGSAPGLAITPNTPTSGGPAGCASSAWITPPGWKPGRCS